MANRVVAPNLFAPNPPNWSLQLLDANANNATGAINDSSLGSVNGPLADTGGVNNYQVTCTYGSPSALNNGMTVFFTPANTNTGPSTLTVSPLSSAPIVSTSSTALAGGELAAGTTIGVVYDGTQFRIFNLPGPSSIWSVRLRSYNAVGNPNYEVDQRLPGSFLTLGTGTVFGWPCDRWLVSKAGATMTLSTQTINSGTATIVPGTNFRITSQICTVTLTAQQASLGAGDYIYISQFVEGPFLRELFNDAHSVSILVNATSALTFSLALCDSPATRTLTKLCQITTPNQWTLITLPNLPVWPVSNFSILQGNIGYVLRIGLAAGSTLISPANDTWQTGNFVAGPGTTNFASLPLNTAIWFAFVQHEPGAVCTTLMDLDFDTNLSRCQRYYQKSYDYGVIAGTIAVNGIATLFPVNTTILNNSGISFKKTMAKVPTVNIYNHATGTLNSVQDIGAVNHAVTATNGPSQNNPFYSLTSSGLTTGTGGACYVHYTADTGW